MRVRFDNYLSLTDGWQLAFGVSFWRNFCPCHYWILHIEFGFWALSISSREKGGDESSRRC